MVCEVLKCGSGEYTFQRSHLLSVNYLESQPAPPAISFLKHGCARLSHLKGLSAGKAKGSRLQKKCRFSQLWKVSSKYQILVDLLTINTSRIVSSFSLSGEVHLHTAPSRSSVLVSFRKAEWLESASFSVSGSDDWKEMQLKWQSLSSLVRAAQILGIKHRQTHLNGPSSTVCCHGSLI